VTHSRIEVVAAYGSTLCLAIVFGTLPALASVLTSPEEFDLGPTLYGLLFVPQALVAIIAALWEGTVTRRLGLKPLLMTALTVDSIAMLLVFLSGFTVGDEVLAYVTLLVASTLMGLAFGLGVPAGISLAGGFFPERRDRAILYLNGMVAFGAGIAPILVALAVGLGEWALMPLALVVVFAIDLAVAVRLPLRLPSAETSAPASRGPRTPGGRAALPRRFWLYTGFMLLYGIVQTLNGSWAQLFMTEDIGATAAQGALALTVFWFALGIGRLTFGSLDHVLPETLVFRVLPFVAAAALTLVALTPTGDVGMALLAFGLTGLGCSALLPLTVSFSQVELVGMRAMMASALVATYLIGFGIASFGVGPLVEHLGVDPSLIYAAAGAIALVLGVMAFVVVRGLAAARTAPPAAA